MYRGGGNCRWCTDPTAPSEVDSCWIHCSCISSGSLPSAASCTGRATPGHPVWSSSCGPQRESSAICRSCTSPAHLQGPDRGEIHKGSLMINVAGERTGQTFSITRPRGTVDKLHQHTGHVVRAQQAVDYTDAERTESKTSKLRESGFRTFCKAHFCTSWSGVHWGCVRSKWWSATLLYCPLH